MKFFLAQKYKLCLWKFLYFWSTNAATCKQRIWCDTAGVYRVAWRALAKQSETDFLSHEELLCAWAAACHSLPSWRTLPFVDGVSAHGIRRKRGRYCENPTGMYVCIILYVPLYIRLGTDVCRFFAGLYCRDAHTASHERPATLENGGARLKL